MLRTQRRDAPPARISSVLLIEPSSRERDRRRPHQAQALAHQHGAQGKRGSQRDRPERQAERGVRNDDGQLFWRSGDNMR